MTLAPTSAPLSAPQLAALLEEMAAQARAGIPWADALENAGRRFGARDLNSLAEQLRQGRDVREVLAEISGKYGPQVAAVVQAGAASGRPSEALAGLAEFIRRRIEYRRRLAIALVYPILLSLFAASLLIVGLVWVSRSEATEFNSLSTAADVEAANGGGPGVDPAVWVTSVRGAAWWGAAWWVVPAVLVLGGIAAFVFRRRIASRLPSRLRAIRWARLAWFADLVALELEQGIPLGEAVRLSAEASGDVGMRQAAAAWNAAEERGGTQGGELQAAMGETPPLLVWTLRNGSESPAGLPEALRRLAAIYGYRSERAANLWTAVLPAVLLVWVAGGLAILFVLVVLGPIYKTFE